MPRIAKLDFMRASPRVPVPRYGSAGAAGIDLGLPMDVRINPGGHIFLDLGVGFDIPENHFMKVLPRSSCCDKKDKSGNPAWEHIVVLDNTVAIIDEDYTGTIKVKLTNNGSETYLGYQGEYIVQAVLQEFTKADKLSEVEKIIKQTKRGDKGFGSTDTK